MKTVRIKKIGFCVDSYTKKNKIKDLIIICTLNNDEHFTIIENVYKRKKINIEIPFSNLMITFDDFAKMNTTTQLEQLSLMCYDYTNAETKVGTYDNNFIDIGVEETIKQILSNINYDPSEFVDSLPIYCMTSLDYFQELIDENDELTSFAKNLISYYKSNNNYSFQNIEDISKYDM
jgi:hypothetical protein